MRKLITGDLFAFARVIKASGIRDELVAYLQKLNADSDKEQVGMTTILMILEALSDKNAENAFYDAVKDIFEVEDVQSLPPSELFAYFKQMAEENDLPNFFNSLFGGLGKN